MTEAALDLSSKSSLSLGEVRLVRPEFSENRTPSPRNPGRHGSTSDGDDSDSSAPSSAIKPVPGPIPKNIRDSDSPCSDSRLNNDQTDSLPSSPSTPSTVTSRPFKSYPLDNIPAVFSSPSSMALLGNHAGLPSGLPMGLGLSSLYEGSPSFPSFPVTPLTSHLLQRKRRAESRSSANSNPESNSDSESKKLKHVPEDKKDNSYWERRRKNNEAAKRSRDNRRHKEEEIAMRAAFLEQENLKLRAQVAILKNETAKLHYMLYNRI